MEKAAILEHLGAAKKAHLKWVQRAKLLIEGLPIDEGAIPLGSTDCKFGQWFYGEGQQLNALGNMGCLTDIEKAHSVLHDQYLKIFKIYFSDDHRSFFSKIFNTKKKISAQDHAEAELWFAKLQATSEELLGYIGKIERRLYAIPQSSFDASETGI